MSKTAMVPLSVTEHSSWANGNPAGTRKFSKIHRTVFLVRETRDFVEETGDPESFTLRWRDRNVAILVTPLQRKTGPLSMNKPLISSLIVLTMMFSLRFLSLPAGADSPESGKQNAKDHRVLRHAVFFSFKPSSSPEEVESVVDAFKALPQKIDSIVGFQHGVNNSPEKLDDGLTHAFLLSFEEEAGRAAYLPHPAHKEFGNVLRPHLQEVFVIDYWGDTNQPTDEGELRHAVFFKFKSDADPEQVQAVEQAFAALPSKINSIKAFEWGNQ